MKILKSAVSVLLLLTILLSLAACGSPGGPETPSAAAPTEAVTELDDAQLARAKQLAAAFALFGDCDARYGLELKQLDRMVYCFYTGELDRAADGVITIAKDEADKTVRGIFRGLEMPELFRAKRGEDPGYYYEDGFYYIEPAESATEVGIRSAKPLEGTDGAQIGFTVVAEVKAEGVMKELELDLVFDEESVFSAARCETRLHN